MVSIVGLLLVSFHLVSSSSQFLPARRESRNVFRRQMTDCNNADIFSANSITCDPRYGQALVDDAAECGLGFTVRSLTQLCSKNENGQFCYKVQDVYESLEENVFQECFFIYLGRICTTACRDAILAYRSRFGCCINIYNESSGNSTINVEQSNELWSSCGVDKPGLCEGSTLESPEVNEKQTCSVEEYIVGYISDYTCGEAGQLVHDNLIACGNTTGADSLRYGVCGKNENGEVCYEKVLGDEIDINETLNDCFLQASDSIACCSALGEIQSFYGCCAYDEIDDDIWSACGLEAPKLCKSTVLILETTVTGETPVTVETTTVTGDNTTAVDNASTNNKPSVLVLPIVAVFAYMIF